MLAINKKTEAHLGHDYSVHRAKPNSPHWGYYRCETCGVFVTWIDYNTYQREKTIQRKQKVMWFGKYQGMPLEQLPQEYLDWCIATLDAHTTKHYTLLQQEQIRRNQQKTAVSIAPA